MKHNIIDNEKEKLRDYLAAGLQNTECFRIVSAYFSIYGYELLQEELESLAETRFLFGDPTSAAHADPGQNESKAFTLTESGLTPIHQLQQKPLAKRCAQWVKRPKVEIRSITATNFLHGKMYHGEKAKDTFAVVGSSNFTKRGLGCGSTPNLELNLAAHPAACEELRTWFDALWEDPDRVKDVKREVLDALARLGKDYAPKLIYFKTLYELFFDELQAQKEERGRLASGGLQGTKIWQALYEFQREGVNAIIRRLQRFNGCILADSVGLGKTYSALAVIKYYELKNQNVLVLCPKKLNENWKVYSQKFNQSNNPFYDDRLNYQVLHHTDLTRTSGESNGIDLGNFRWEGYDLIVIDESHNFRNASVSRHDEQGNITHYSRYKWLLEQVIKRGGNTKVLLLSATPVNTSLTDLRNQFQLIAGNKADAFADSLQIRDFKVVLNQAQKQFKTWEGNQSEKNTAPDKAELLHRLGDDFLRLLHHLTVSRSRRHIKEYYSKDMKSIGKFPARAKPENYYPNTDTKGELSYIDLATQIGKFSLSIYQPTKYLRSIQVLKALEAEKKERNFNQADREKFLIDMIKINFLKRLESSAFALQLTFDRTIKKIDDLLDKIAEYEKNPSKSEEYTASGFDFSDLDLQKWKKNLLKDREVLQTAYSQVAKIDPDRDGKLQQIKKDITERIRKPSENRVQENIKKILIFTTFKDTAVYLYNELQTEANKLGVRIALVAGDTCDTTLGKKEFNHILTNFAPRARKRKDNATETTQAVTEEIDILIATDCISEGQNLQDCDTVLNYDIHWNPVRLIQRSGRIDRIGSLNDSVRNILYWPTEDLAAYLKLQKRVRQRMALVDIAATGDEDPFDEDEVEMTIAGFREQQLELIREDGVDLSKLEDTEISLSDFSFEHFIHQLLQHFEKHELELKNTPPGAYAVVGTDDKKAQAGVIFVLRQREAETDRAVKVASAVHPHYLVYIGMDNTIRAHCGGALEILKRFDAIASEEEKPLTELCDIFDRETKHGKDMKAYEQLIKTALADITKRSREKEVGGIFSGDRGARLGRKQPDKADNFQLVTWLVILPENGGSTAG